MTTAEFKRIRDNSGTHAVTHLVIENNKIERLTENPPQWILSVEARIARVFDPEDTFPVGKI